MIWRANIDWYPVLSKHVVINYIEKYAPKYEKKSETIHDMLMRVSSIQNPNEPAERAFKALLCETIIDRDIGAQETCHLLLQLPLSDCSHRFIVLNVGMKVFKQVQVGTYNVDNDNSPVDSYTKQHVHIDHLPLIDVKKSWSYYKR